MEQTSEEKQQIVKDVLATLPEIIREDENTEESIKYLETFPKVRGYDFNEGLDYEKLFDSYLHTGVQAYSLAKGIDIINKMISWRLSDEEIAEDEEEKYKDPEVRKNTRCTIFLGYVSNTVTSGLREIVRYLCQHKMVDAIVTTTGAIEEDFIKLTNNFHIGDFSFKGAELYKQGLYRYGNILGANEAYMDFEEFMLPLIKKLYDEQVEKGTIFTPSMLINRMGKEINNEDSIYYWCWKNDIPVFCPGITDGAVGDNLFKFNYYQKGFIIDVVADAYKINNLSIDAKKSGMILLGGGIAKHHICNANQMRQGADYAVYINTAQEFDCSDSGARPDEAVSWYKIKVDAEMVKIYSDTSIVFPIIVARTFYKHYVLATRLSEDNNEVD